MKLTDTTGIETQRHRDTERGRRRKKKEEEGRRRREKKKAEEGGRGRRVGTQIVG